PQPHSLDLRALDGVLAAACAVLAVVAGYISALRWRLVGDASSLRVGSALLLFGGSVVLAQLVPFVDESTRADYVGITVSGAMALTVVAALTVSVMAPPVDTRLTARRHAIGVLVTVTTLTGLVVLLPEFKAFALWNDVSTSAGVDIAAQTALVVVWVTLGVVS